MFKLFGKKKEEPKPQPTADTGAAHKAFAADFLPEERSYLAVTDTTGMTGSKLPDSKLMIYAIRLSAWMDEELLTLHRDPAALVMLGDDRLFTILRPRLPANFILKFKARLSQDGTRLLLTDLPQPGFDPDLKALLEEQKKPVTLDAGDLGEFTLSRAMNWFQADVDWLDRAVQVTFPQDEDHDTCLGHIRTLLADPARWEESALSCAAEQLLDQANEALQDDEDFDDEELTAEDFMERIALESIQVSADGRLDFWLDDGQIFWGRGIQVSGTLAGGLTDAQVEG